MRRCDVHFLQAGYCRHPEVATLTGGSLSSAVFPALAGLILHPIEGPVLFDTGYDEAFFRATDPFPQRLYRWLTPPTLPEQASVRLQLKRFGLSPADVKWVILSHFHADHIAGLRAFEHARIACAKSGLDAARRGGVVRALLGGVLRDLIPSDIDSRLVFFEERPRTALPGAFRPFAEGSDIFGDGSLLAVELPGHSPGHWGLVGRGADDGLHFLVADAAWTCRAIRENRSPPWITTAFLGNTRSYRATLHNLHRMQTDAPEVLVTPSHCAERAAQIETASMDRRA